MSKKLKRCTKCRRLKAVGEFPRDAHQNCQLSPRCRQCHKRQHKSYYLKRRAAILAQQKTYNAAHAEIRRNWRRRHRATLRAYAQRYAAERRTKLRKYHRTFKARQPERIRRKPSKLTLKPKASPIRSNRLKPNRGVFPTALPINPLTRMPALPPLYPPSQPGAGRVPEQRRA